MDTALAHVDPDRRKFLGILLAGVAAAPLLTSASLTAENQAHFPKNELKSQSHMKAQTWTKGGTMIKNGSANTIKWDNKNNTQIKGAQIKGENSAIKNGAPSTIKGANTQIKLQPNAIKGENTAIKGETKPVQH